ncbi:coiled-coil domain-containing protein 73-like [Frieseomelitta varia]|uniref:coiled-coil domain-containing protein 73-like n=1 Tax=Frieseomelitta varia TaxID=561572 RepID=UPI001CB6B124|nr:coiled-coil domain-containing protein 73-like [Frieseomelitta varia]
MQQEDDNYRSEFTSCNITPEKLQETPRTGFGRRDIMSSQEVKRRINYTPQKTPNKHPKTPQGTEPLKKDAKSQLEATKRKSLSPCKETPEKIQKTCSSGKFINTLIAQWSKHMGVQTPVQSPGVQENSIAEEMKQMYAIEERKVQKLQKKLQVAEETISLLSASHEAELRTKEEILQQLNSDWESITKYYYEISESLKGFQQHKDNLSKLYNDVILTQQSTVKKLQQELSTMKLKYDEQRNIVSTIENKVKNQEKRIHEMMIVETELKKQFQDMKNKSVLEKNHLHNVHAEEKLELMKKQENLTSMNQELQLQLQKITEEKQDLTTAFTEKDDEITKLQEKIITCKNKIEDLLSQNTELSSKYERLIIKEEELSKQLQSREQKIEKLQENLNARQQIESSLAQDLNIIDNKYKNIRSDFTKVENKLKEAQIQNLNLEQSLQVMKHDNEYKIVELNKKIEFLEKEKERVCLEKHSKILELERAYKLLEEKHKASLKQEYDVKLRLNEALNKMNEDNQKKQTNYLDQHTKASRNKIQNLQERIQPLVESNITEAVKELGNETQKSQVCEMKEEQFQDQENVDRSKIISKDKNEISDLEQDVYSFTNIKFNDELSNVSDSTENHSYLFRDKNITYSNTQIERKQKKENKDNTTTRKRIFKTRGIGLRQYVTPKSLQYGTPGKISKK